MTALKRLLVHSSLFMVILLGFAPQPAGAACWCAGDNPACRCGRNETTSFSTDVVISPAIRNPKGPAQSAQTVKVYCDQASETTNPFAVNSPICGSAVETSPDCAITNDQSQYICWGADFVSHTLSNNNGPVDMKGQSQFTFNGVTHQLQRDTNYRYGVFVCGGSLACCGQNSCPGITPLDKPVQESFCTYFNRNPSGAESICTGTYQLGDPNTQPNFTGQSDTDARIYFPHVKNTSSITYLLQSMYRPISWTIDQIKNNVVYSKVFEHQGIPPDNTPVINKTDDNSSVIPNRPAPAPVFDFTHPPPGVPDNGACVISNVRTNPGDDLLGKKIYADMEYTQKFQYQSLLDGSCKKTGFSIFNGGRCCSGSARSVTDPITGETVDIICNPAWVILPTKGKTLVYTKSPFLEYLYQNLVAGPAAIYRRFVSASTAAEIKDVPSQATYLASAKEIIRKQPSDLKDTPTQIYFPHLGSIYDYFLKNLQKLLRPKDTADTTSIIPSTIYTPGQTPLNPTCQSSCSSPNLLLPIQQIAAVAGSIYNVPPSLIIGILWSEGGLNKPISDADIRTNRHPYLVNNTGDNRTPCNCPNGATGACGPAQIIGSADGFLKKLALPQVRELAQNLGWNVSLPYEPNRCSYSDSIFEIADKLSVGRGGVDYQAVHGESQQCIGVTMNNNLGPSTSCNWSDADVVTAARQYLGYCEESNHVPLYSYDTPSDNCKNNPNECYQQKLLNFMASNCQQNFTSPTQSTAPAPAPVVSGGGFTVSGTPTQICQAVGFGIRQQAGTNNCVRCLGGQVASGYGSTSNVFPCPIKMQNTNVCSDVTTDFATTPIPNDSTVDKPNGLDNWPDGLKARCFQSNVIDIQPGSIIDTSQGQYSCPLGQFCRVGDAAKSGTDTSCQPQICSNPGVKVGSGVTSAGGQGKFCCVPNSTSP